jgi:polyisoprenoid-binding protein YceI
MSQMRKSALVVVGSVVFLGAATMMAFGQPAPAPAGNAAAPPMIHDPAAVPAGTYVADPAHSSLTGNIQRGGLSYIAFRFKRFDAKFTYDPSNLEMPVVEVTIDPSSINTDTGLDTYLATSENYFDVEKFAEIKFVSNSLKRTGPDKGILSGTITFLGVTKPLDFDVTFISAVSARTTSTVAFSATTTIHRSDFGFNKTSKGLADAISVAVNANFVKR